MSAINIIHRQEGSKLAIHAHATGVRWEVALRR